MRILLTIQHPAHAWQFKYFIKEMEEKGHVVKVLAINKDKSIELLEAFNIKHDVISNTSGNNMIEKGIVFIILTIKIIVESVKFKPDLFLGRAMPMLGLARWILRKKFIFFEDTENAGISLALSKIFADVIITPTKFGKDFGKKHIRINSYKELFYLHPDKFTPNPTILKKLGLTEDSKYTILRFVAWRAMHDVGQRGLDLASKRKIIHELNKYGKVFITSEATLPKEFEKYRLDVPVEVIHDILSYSSLFVGDSQTMAAESAILGTPVVRCNSFNGIGDMSNFIELEQNYSLLYSYNDSEKATKKAVELIKQHNVRKEWHMKREILLSDKIDATEFLVDFIDRWPESFKEQQARQART